jgi:hypothetical protein
MVTHKGDEVASCYINCDPMGPRKESHATKVNTIVAILRATIAFRKCEAHRNRCPVNNHEDNARSRTPVAINSH